MRIQHNIAALNSHRNLTNNNSAVAKNLEKLSSGYRINRAGDDAAGLAISEKMRAQITGLETAQKNAQDGISLVQTAEGALTEVHSMLNRMVELATQSANGTYDDKIDRDNLQKEMDALVDEVDRISKATNFNGINLLDGSLGGPKISSAVGKADKAEVPGNPGAAPTVGTPTTVAETIVAGDGTTTKASISADFAGMTITAPTDGSTGAKATITIGGQNIKISADANMTDTEIAAALDGQTITVDGVDLIAKATGTTVKFEATAAADGQLTAYTTGNVSTSATAGTTGGTPAVLGSKSNVTLDFDGRTGADLIGGSMTVGGKTYNFVKEPSADTLPTGVEEIILREDDDADTIAAAVADKLATVSNEDGTEFTGQVDGSKITYEPATNGADETKSIKFAFKGIGLNLQIGDTPQDFNNLTVSVASMSAEALGIDATQVDISTQIGAKSAIDKIKAAINTVSSTRGDLGAVQNRLEHTINNLSVTTENMTAAESRIRDVDMAKEMMAYTKNNILVQASQAMLAQANQLPQGVLQLLQ